MPVPPAPSPARKPRRVLLSIVLVVIGVLALVFVAIQFIPVNRANAAVTTPIKWDSPQTEALARRACMVCHSSETTWPWYSYVAPASWLIYYDVVRGRQQLNFDSLAAGVRGEGGRFNQPTDLAYTLGRFIAGDSQRRGPGGDFGPGGPGGQFPTRSPGQQDPGGGFQGFGGGNRFAEQIQRGSMPPAKYTLIHPSASLTAAEQQQLIDGLNKTFGAAGGD